MISLEYGMFEEKISVLVVEDETSAVTLAYDCVAKWPADEWVVRQLARDLERRDICVQSDDEPAMIALQQALAKPRPGCKTMTHNSPPYNPQSKGGG